jgi:hypothetical protein
MKQSLECWFCGEAVDEKKWTYHMAECSAEQAVAAAAEARGCPVNMSPKAREFLDTGTAGMFEQVIGRFLKQRDAV